MTVDRALLWRSAPPVSKQALEVEKPLVIIIDDDAAIGEALSELILSAGFETVSFGSTRELLEAEVLDSPGCLILDVRMPGVSGLDLQRQLAGTVIPSRLSS
jgi:FixJ family two-component response regulator